MGFSRKAEDPEPGRCRRTDGKKWRCSKEAYPDSKYCEKHMHRGKNRSRKPVEMPLASTNPNPSPSSASSASSASRTSPSPYASSLSISTPQPYSNLLYSNQMNSSNSSSSSSHFHNASSYYSADRDYRLVCALTKPFISFFWFILESVWKKIEFMMISLVRCTGTCIRGK